LQPGRAPGAGAARAAPGRWCRSPSPRLRARAAGCRRTSPVQAGRRTAGTARRASASVQTADRSCTCAVVPGLTGSSLRCRCSSAICSMKIGSVHGSASSAASRAAITSVAASSTTGYPVAARTRSIEVLPAPGAPVRMNRFMGRGHPGSAGHQGHPTAAAPDRCRADRRADAPGAERGRAGRALYSTLGFRTVTEAAWYRSPGPGNRH